jgi:hypothetical protein
VTRPLAAVAYADGRQSLMRSVYPVDRRKHAAHAAFGNEDVHRALEHAPFATRSLALALRLDETLQAQAVHALLAFVVGPGAVEGASSAVRPMIEMVHGVLDEQGSQFVRRNQSEGVRLDDVSQVEIDDAGSGVAIDQAEDDLEETVVVTPRAPTQG